MEFRFDYQKCEACENRKLCSQCEENLTEMLLLEPEIRCITLQMPDKILSVSSDLELPALETLLRNHGVNVH